MLLPMFRGMIGGRTVVPGSQTYGPGTYSFVIPSYNTITFDLIGSGGGGGGTQDTIGAPTGFAGQTGGQTTINALSLVCNGGTGGAGSTGSVAANGSPGTASGGDSNLTGSGFGGGAGATNGGRIGGTGGSGARCIKTYAAGVLTPGNTVTIIVGSGGTGGANGNSGAIVAGSGGNARVDIAWS